MAVSLSLILAACAFSCSMVMRACDTDWNRVWISTSHIKHLHILIAIASALLSLGIRDRLREEARAVEVDVRVEVIRTEIIDQTGAV